VQSLETKQLSRQSYTQATTKNNKIPDMPLPGPVLVEPTAGFWPYQISTPQERESSFQRGIADIQNYCNPKLCVLAAWIKFGTNKF